MSDLAAPASPALVLPRLLAYPERRSARESALDRWAAGAEAVVLARATRWRARRLASIVERVAQHGDALAGHDDRALMREARIVAALLKRHPEWPPDIVARSFAVIREAASRVLGQRHYDVQLIAGYAMLRGMIAEMATGEGKTLAATLAAATAALGGVPVHVVTVNAYLAGRDAAQMQPLYRFLGLSVGVVSEQIPAPQRAAAYRCDITYCTNKDLAFDYMRDRLDLGRRVGNLRRKAATLIGARSRQESGLLRGLHFAIVDEADSVLIDEARTPLILSGESDADQDAAVFDQALGLGRGLRFGIDYHIFGDERRVALLAPGRRKLAAAETLGAPWNETPERERLVNMALTALHVLEAGENYLVREGRVEIIDEFSGRIMPDRRWSDGLHEMVERKEGLVPSKRRGTRARMTYQRFFRRYCRLAGMTGTAREVAQELWRVYRLPVATIPPHRPDRKVMLPSRTHATVEDKWRAIVEQVATMHRRGAPVLIGTRTVVASARASEALAAAGLAHVVLSAAQDAAEAEIVERAGERGAITVATNMAGRGTDIRLSAEAAGLGGLHVVISEPHEAGRIDRQLAGRCGRQGDPGLVQAHVSLEDALIDRHAPRPLIAALRLLRPGLSPSWVRLVAAAAQRQAERLHARMRHDLLKSDEWLGDAIAFSGEQE